MKKQLFSDKFKELFLPVSLFLVVCLLTAVVLIPKIKETIVIKQKIDAQNQEIQKLSAKITDLQTLSEPELFDSSNLLLTAVPTDKDFYQLLSSMRKVFTDNSANLVSFSLIPGIVSTQSSQLKSRGIDNMKIKLAFSVNPENLKTLVLKLEKSLPLVEITSIKFDSVTSSSSAAVQNWEGTIEIQSFSTPLPNNLGSFDKDLAKISASDQKIIDDIKTYGRIETTVETPETSTVVGKDNPFPF